MYLSLQQHEPGHQRSGSRRTRATCTQRTAKRQPPTTLAPIGGTQTRKYQGACTSPSPNTTSLVAIQHATSLAVRTAKKPSLSRQTSKSCNRDGARLAFGVHRSAGCCDRRTCVNLLPILDWIFVVSFSSQPKCLTWLSKKRGCQKNVAVIASTQDRTRGTRTGKQGETEDRKYKKA